MSFIFLCIPNIVTMKRLDWKPRRIKYNNSHLNLPLWETMVFYFLYLTLPKVSTFSNPFSSTGRDINARWELSIESSPLTCCPNQNLICQLHQCDPALKTRHSEFVESLYPVSTLCNCVPIFNTNISHFNILILTELKIRLF